jgi:plasmid stabilization system protein ParE
VTRYKVSILPPAEAEIREAFAYYLERSPIAADAYRTEVFDSIDRLATNAEIWPRDEEGFHYYHLRHFPFTIHYELDGELVTVMAVAHQRRRPKYWRPR